MGAPPFLQQSPLGREGEPFSVRGAGDAPVVYLP